MAGPVSKPVTHRIFTGGQVGDVGDAAEIDDRAGFDAACENRPVKGRRERRALAAGGHVGAAKIGHHRDAGELRDKRAVAELERERKFSVRAVADGLPVTADDRHAVAAGFLF